MGSNDKDSPNIWYAWFPLDFAASANVRRMNYEEKGVYRELFDLQFIEGSIPADEAELAELLNLPLKKFQSIWKKLSRCFKPIQGDENRLQHPRLEKERGRIDKMRSDRKEAGAKGGKSKAEKAKKIEAELAELEQSYNEKLAKLEQGYSKNLAELKQSHDFASSKTYPIEQSRDKLTSVSSPDQGREGTLADVHTQEQLAIASQTKSEPTAPTPDPQRPPAPAEKKSQKNKAEPSKRDLGGWAITNAMVKLLAPHLEGVETQADWKSRNNDAARKMFDAGLTPQAVAEAWATHAEQGFTYTALSRLQEAMVRDKAIRNTPTPINALRGGQNAPQTAVMTRGFVYYQPVEIKKGTMLPGFDAWGPPGVAEEKILRWVRDGVDEGGWPSCSFAPEAAIA